MRGKGYAAVVTKAAIDYCRANDITFFPGCTYVQRYLDKEKEEAKSKV